LVVGPSQWPHGMAWLTDYLHQRGLLAGIYTDPGASGCDGQGVGSLGHYHQDADTFAAWGFDAVKVDFCGAAQAGLPPQSQYTQFAHALANNSSHRPMLLNVTNFWEPGQIDGTRPSWADSAYANYQWAPAIAQSWCADTDVGFGGGRGIRFANVLRNLDADAAHPEAAGPGHWNDPDYLGPELGMTSGQAQAQFSMWAMLAAPLILGSDPRGLSAQTITMLANQRVIAVDQDPLGAQARAISSQGSGQVWVKPLADGSRAVALLNRGTSARQITTSAAAVGLPSAASYRLEDLWTGQMTTSTGSISTSVPGQSAVLYRIEPVLGAPAADAPTTAAASLLGVVAVAGPGRHLYVHAPQLAAGWHNLGGDIRAAPAVANAPGRAAAAGCCSWPWAAIMASGCPEPRARGGDCPRGPTASTRRPPRSGARLCTWPAEAPIARCGTEEPEFGERRLRGEEALTGAPAVGARAR
jgi:alpha-galactosidase